MDLCVKTPLSVAGCEPEASEDAPDKDKRGAEREAQQRQAQLLRNAHEAACWRRWGRGGKLSGLAHRTRLAVTVAGCYG
jgi:hypothetical protein